MNFWFEDETNVGVYAWIGKQSNCYLNMMFTGES